jgi:hypothetical protein
VDGTDSVLQLMVGLGIICVEALGSATTIIVFVSSGPSLW